MPYKSKDKERAYEKKRNATPKRRKMRSMNVTARRKMAKKVGAAAIAGKDVDHKKPISKGGGNGYGNLRVMSAKQNRSRARKKK